MDARSGSRVPDPASLARKFLGTPFVHQGRLPYVGLDCVGLLVAVAREMGLDPIDCTSYPMIPTDGFLLNYLDKNLVQDPEGPVAAFWVRRPTDPIYHAAIIDGDKMIHTYYNLGKVVEHTFDERWQKRVHSRWQLSH